MPPGWWCPTCGQKISPSIGECLFCPPDPAGPLPAPPAEPEAPGQPDRPPPAARAPGPPEPVPASEEPPAEASAPKAPAAIPAVPEAAAAPAAGDPDRAFGLLLFDVEEALARGQAERAMVLASRAVRGQPAHLTARSLYDRARRELLRGRRREKLEARVAEAQRRAAAGDLDGAEKIAATALKLIPDHAAALALFSDVRARRLQAGTAEAEAERELGRLLRARALLALDTARAARAAGREFRALMALRRGLALAPGDPDLLAVYAESAAALEASRSRRHAARPGPALPGPPADPIPVPALAEPIPAPPAAEEAGPAPPAAPIPEPAPGDPATAAAARPAAAAGEDTVPAAPEAPPPAVVAPLRLAAPTPPADIPLMPRASSRPPIAPPVDEASAPSRRPTPAATASTNAAAVRLPATRRRGTPWPAIAIGAAVSAGILVFLLRGGAGKPRPPAFPAPPSPSVAAAAAAPAPPRPVPEGPLTSLDPRLREAIEATLRIYASALETVDASALAAARPDLTAETRAVRLRRLEGAINVGVDLRVLDVRQSGETAEASVLRTEVVVGGRAQPQPPTEETLRFRRSGANWSLDHGR